MNYHWAYLCSSTERLRLTLKFLPAEPFQSLDTMHVCWCSHLDPMGRRQNLITTLHDHAPKWLKWEVTDLSPLVVHLPPALNKYYANEKTRWSLGVKLLLPFLFNGPYLYTDDDVIVPQDPRQLLYSSFGSKGCFRFEGKKLPIVEQLFDVFECQRPAATDGHYNRKAADLYDAHALDAGVWFTLNGLKESVLWKYYLDRLASVPYVADLTTRNLELRCLDQRFLTMFGMRHQWRVQSIGNGFAPPQRIRPNFFLSKNFFHYKSSSKARWMQLLQEHLDGRA